MSNYITDVVTSVLPVGYVTVKDVMGCTVAGSLSASLQLMNDHVVPLSNMAGIANLWV